MISWLNDLLNYCCLRFLIEGISHGNKAIKIGRIKLSSNPESFFREDIEDIGEDGIHWFTVQALISDFWRAYKFLPFKDKFEYLVKAVEYKPDGTTRGMIFKHIIIRNCIQHHDWILEKTSLASLGRSNIETASSSGPITVSVWKKIPLTFEEVSSLFEVLNKFADDFSKHVNNFVKTRVYVREEDKQ